MKDKLLFLSKLLIFSLPLTFLLPKIDWACRYALASITSSAPISEERLGAMFYVSIVKLYPFFVLVLATPRLGVKRRIGSIAAAVAVYLILDLLMINTWQVAPFQKRDPSMTHIFASNVWEMLGKWLLPFLFWIIAAFRQIEELVAPKKA